MKREVINPDNTLGTYERLHFSQATRVGNLVWVSGQVGIDRATGVIPEDPQAQARVAFEGVKQILEAAGSSLDNIVELTTFHTDMAKHGPGFGAVKDEFIGEPYPSWTGIGVSQLARPEFVCEIRVVATLAE
ncbi:RidA family protein [Nocardia cyriacigeorgica]|uniref:RidA family protein n=1 Tax=Nocardia cyriacigeorgica TaxID=135487 RepID=UPI0024573FEE|nr:RidA family protein [Nocardia cyriacigeorgica]